jgi:predicted small secreted protein
VKAFIALLILAACLLAACDEQTGWTDVDATGRRSCPAGEYVCSTGPAGVPACCR